jgi:PAS domain S-box-containing protein
VQLRTRVVELERLLALTPVGVAIAEDPQCRVVRANAAMHRLLGQSADAELSLATAPRWRLRRDGRDLPVDEWPFQRAAAQGVEIPPRECELTFDDGRVVNVLVSAAPLLRHDRSPGGCIGVMVDISDQKRIEAALVEQAERLQLQAALLENAHDAIIVRDTQGWISFWNRGAARLYGWSEDEALGKNVHELLWSDAAVLDRVRAVLAAAGEWQGELQQRRKDGSRVVVDSLHATLDASGAPDSILEINRDVSDRKQAEEQRAEMLARLALLLEVSESLSAAATPEEITEILLDKGMPALGAYAGMVGVLSDDGREVEVLGSRGYSEQARRAYARLPLAVSSPIGDAISSGTTVLVMGSADWHSRYPSLAPALSTSASRAFAAIPLRGSRVLGAIGLSFDEPGALNSRDSTFASLLARQAAQALERADLLVSERRAHAEAEEASRIKDDFLATLSHELRTPLNAILGWSHMLLADALSAESQRHAIEVIARNATTQVRLVDEVLDLSRIVRGQLHLDLRPVDVRAVIHRALDTARPAAAAKGLTLDVRLPEALETIADADRLQQVVWNLLSNAVKFTPAGGRITVTAQRGPASLDIDVRDTGIGITPAFLPHVFERFRQADSSTTRHHGGLGLGLAIVRHIMELHGGTVAAQSGGSGAGSRFTLTLPLRQTVPPSAPDAPETGQLPAHATDGHLLAGIRVLVVDDDADARDVLEAILAGAGAQVTLASSAGEAMELLSTKAPDLIVSDISMPGQDGYGFIRAVRAMPDPHAGLPAIAVTAYGHPADRATALAAGFDRHVTKPLTPRDLVAAVATLARTGAANADE